MCGDKHSVILKARAIFYRALRTSLSLRKGVACVRARACDGLSTIIHYGLEEPGGVVVCMPLSAFYTLYSLQGGRGSTTQPVAVGQRLAEQCSDKLATAHQLKDVGNTAFKAGNFKLAIKKYHHSLMYTRGVVSKGDVSAIPGMEHVVKYMASEEEKRQARELTAVLSNNLAGTATLPPCTVMVFINFWKCL